MKGQSVFSKKDAARIRVLLNEKLQADRESQKRIRDEIRAVGFYISDFTTSNQGFSPTEFDELVVSGLVQII